MEHADAAEAGDEHVDWADFSSVWQGNHLPADVHAAFERAENTVGVALIALALCHPDPQDVLPLVAKALESPSPQVREQGTVALAHTARLHRIVDQRCLVLLHEYPRGNVADDDLWSFVPHRELPLWLWRHQAKERMIWWLHDRWQR